MRRIAFAAIVAYLDRATDDGRLLVAPEILLHHAYPLPVFGYNAATGQRDRVGMIEIAAVCDRRLIVFGRMTTGPEAKPYVDRLSEGSAWLELDLSHIETETEEPTNTDPDPVTRFTSWSLACATIGESPCWDLPPVQIEEFTNA